MELATTAAPTAAVLVGGPKTIEQHLDEYASDRRAYGRTNAHLYATREYVLKAARAGRWVHLTDATEDSARLFLLSLTGHPDANGNPTDATPKYRNNVRGYLSAFFAWCVKRGRLDVSPIDRIEKFPDRRGKQLRCFKVDELTKLLDFVITRDGGDEAHDVYLLVPFTGLRRSELKNLCVYNLLLEEQTPTMRLEWDLPGNKGKRIEDIPLVSPQVVAMLRRRIEGKLPTDRVFRVVPHPNVVERDVKRAGLDKKNAFGQRLTLHSLRHTLGTMLALAGVQPKVAQLIMRHRDIRLTMELYAQAELMPKAAGLEAAARFFRGASPELKLTAQRDEVRLPSSFGVDPMSRYAEGSVRSAPMRATGSSPVAPI